MSSPNPEHVSPANPDELTEPNGIGPLSSSFASREPNPHDEWWGHSAKHAWVVFDRRWSANAVSLRGPLLLVRCLDWSFRSEPWKVWSAFETYRFAPRYLETLRPNGRAVAEGELRMLYLEYAQRRPALGQAAMAERLQQFCERTHRKADGARWADSSQYDRPCWRCARRFNSKIDLQCTDCSWFTCWECGACGCNWPWRRWR